MRALDGGFLDGQKLPVPSCKKRHQRLRGHWCLAQSKQLGDESPIFAARVVPRRRGARRPSPKNLFERFGRCENLLARVIEVVGQAHGFCVHAVIVEGFGFVGVDAEIALGFFDGFYGGVA